MTPPSLPELSVGMEDARGADAARLIDGLCAELSERYHRPPSPFLPEEAMTARTAFVVARWNGEPVGCGALRQIDDTTVEVKRMYVTPDMRRRGISRRILVKLETLAAGFSYERIILETGTFQPEALALYHAAGYRRTANYGRYVGNPEAHCFEKEVERRVR